MEKFFSWSVSKLARKRARTVTEFEKKRLKMRPHFGYRLLYWELGAIHRAASAGNVAAVEKMLICRRSGVDDVDHKSRTALHWACAKGHQDVVAFLISQRCLLDPQDKRAATPLIKAVQCPAENCATLLLDHGADPNIEDEIGNTALHYVAYGENIRMAEKLLSSNADIEKKNKTGLTPLLVAIQQNQETMVKFLILQNADVFAVDNLNRTSLMFAGRYSTENIVHMLLELGVDVLSEDIAGHSARDYALQKRNMQNYQLISLFRENAALEKIVNTNPDDEHSKEYRKRLLEIPDVNHELLISYEKGLNSFAKKDLIPGHTTAIIHSAPEEQPNNDRITRVHGVHEDNKCGAEDEAKESTSDPEEGTSTIAGKKSKKCFFITQVAPQQPINKHGMDSDHTLDKDNKRSKESTTQRDPEDNNSPRNSKAGTSAVVGKKSKKRFFIAQVAPQQPIMNSDHGLDKDNKRSKESTSQRDPEDNNSPRNSKAGTSAVAGKKSKKPFFIAQVAPQQPIMNSDHGLDKDNKRSKESTSQRDPEDNNSPRNSKEGMSTLASKKGLKDIAITQVAPQQPINEYAFNYDRGLDNGNMGSKESTSQRDPEDNNSPRNSKAGTSAVAGKKSKKRFFIAQVAPQQPIMNSDHGLDKDNKRSKESTSQRDPEDNNSPRNSKEGMSTLASKKGLKDIAITQVAPQQPINEYAFNYDRGLDNGNMGSKESTSQRDPEDNNSPRNSKEGMSTLASKKGLKDIAITQVAPQQPINEYAFNYDRGLDNGNMGSKESTSQRDPEDNNSPRNSKAGTSAVAGKKSKKRFFIAQVAPQQPIMNSDHGLDKDNKRSKESTSQRDPEDNNSPRNSKEGMSTLASKKGLKDIAITQVAPQQPINEYAFNYDRGLDNGKESTSQRDPEDNNSPRNSKEGMSTLASKKGLKDIAITQVAPQQPINEYAFNYDRGLDNGNMGSKESTSQRDPEDNNSPRNSKEGMSTLASKKGLKDIAITQVAPQQPINEYAFNYDRGLDNGNMGSKESTSQRDPEDNNSPRNSKEGMSTLASKKGLKDIAITQVAPQQPINEYAFNYDRGLDNGNMGSKESTSQRDPEDNNSPRNSKEESSAEPLKREEVAVPISGISDEAVESPWDSEEETSSGKGEGRAATGGVPEGDILDYFLSCSWARIAKERKASMASSGDTEKDVAVSLSAQEHAKDTLSGIAGVPEDKTIDMPGFRPDDEPLKYSLKSEAGTSAVAGKKSKKCFFITQVDPHQLIMNSDHGLDKDNKRSKESTSQSDPEDSNSPRNSKEGTSALAGKKSKKCFFITQVDPQQPINKYGLDSDHALDKDNKCSKESTFQRDPEDSNSPRNSKTISTNSWKESINQSMAADAKGKDMNEPLEEFANGSTELTPRLEAIHPFWATSVGMNEVQTCRQVTGRIKLKPIPKHLKRHFLPHCNTNQYKSTELELKNVKSSPTNNDIKTAPKEEQEWLDGSENKQFEEKGQHCQSKEMEVLRNLHESAAPPDDSDGCGLNQQRQSGDLDNQQSATKKSEEYYSCPALHVKEIKNENEKVTSMEYGIRPVFENGFSLTRSLLQVIYDNNLSELDRLKREQLRRKEKQYHKEEVKQEEVTHRTLEMDVRTSKNNLTQFQESEDEQKAVVQNTEKIQDHLEKHDQENRELKDTILKQAREIKNLQEILFRLISVDMKHLQQQQDYIEKRQCKSEASLRDMAQFYLKLNSKMQDIMNKLDEIVRKFQVSENLHQGVVENVKKTQDYLEHYISRLQSEILEMKDIVKLHAGSIEELQKNLIRPSSLQTSEHTRKKAAQEESDKELEKPRQLHVQVGETLTCNLNKAHEELTVVRTEFLQETERNESLPSTSTVRPAVPSSSVGNVHGGLMCKGNHVPQRKLRIPTSQLQLSRNRTLDCSYMVSPDDAGCCCMNSKIEIQNLKKELSDLRRQSKDEQQHIMLLAELNQALQDKLDEEMKKNGDLGDKITQPALCCGPGVQWRKAQVLGPCTPWETRRSTWLLPSDQHGAPAAVHQPQRPLDGEPTKKASCQKSSEYLMESGDISKSIQKEHRIHVGISTLSKMKAPQEAISKELEESKQLLLEGFEDVRRKQDEIIQVAKAFSKQVNEANEVLAEVRTKNFLLEKQQTGTLTKSVSTQTVSTQTSVASHSVGNCANSFWLSRDLTPQQNLETPTSATQASRHNTAESLDTFALQDLDTSTLWERCFQIIEKYRSQENLPSCQNEDVESTPQF
ncbi:ankyrin repeat domain-containing protein 26 isoform X12 [Oryctolagus cuniculus]|uniref:ankyrin repeat domain-containing protein 26 isoform X12 n=1 Tax=Oryctolagus cuniculus TaxID=9986 RepID=UPI00387A7B37